MSLQRGTYGIEFDGQQRSPLRKWWLPAILVLVIGAPLLLLRGCAGRSGPSGQADEAAPGQTRYSVPEVETRRERPSIWRHFLNFGWRGGAARSQQTVDGGTPTAGERWLNAERKTAPATAVQSAEVKSLLEQVARHETADELVRARQVLHQILIRRDADDVRAFVERKIGEINTALLFGDRAMPKGPPSGRLRRPDQQAGQAVWHHAGLSASGQRHRPSRPPAHRPRDLGARQAGV